MRSFSNHARRDGCLPSISQVGSVGADTTFTIALGYGSDAASARGGFACMFSTSDEYETALITERRAQGRYHQPRSRWPLVMFAGCALMVAGTVLLLN